MTEEQFGQWVIDNYNIEVEFNLNNPTRTPDGMNQGTITLRRGGHEKSFNYQWVERAGLPHTSHGTLICGFIFDWSAYENDKQEAFDNMETIEMWESYVDEIQFLETIFNEDEKSIILNKSTNFY